MTLKAILGGGHGVIYVSTDDGRLLYYRDEARNGNGVWSFGGTGKQIGIGWNVFRHVFSGDDGIIYAINAAGDLMYYRDEARNGNGVWSFGGKGKQIGTGWGAFRHVFSGGGGIIYAIDASGALLYYRDEARNGNGVWSFGGKGKQIGTGWANFRHVFSGDDGIIYAVNAAGDLLYYRDEARNGNGVWSFGGVGQRIGSGWNRMRRIFYGGDGIIYAINANNDLLYYRDEARNGRSQWSFGGTGKRIGEGWNAVTPDFQITTRWGLCIVAFTGAARGTKLSANWARNAFSGDDGIASYFAQASGGRHRIDAEVFGPVEIMTIAQKQAADAAGGAPTLITELRKAAKAKGVPVERFDRMMWLIDDGISTLGTTPSDSLVGAMDFTPQNAMHEIAHDSGICSHADVIAYDDYGSTFCIMGGSRSARGFDDQRLRVSLKPLGIGYDLSHARSGPGLCAPYLYEAGWLDTVANTTEIPPAPGHGSPFALDANQGAPSHQSGSKVALTAGAIPRQIGAPSQYWVEYRHPARFDRAIDRPAPEAPPDYPPEGLLLVHEVQLLPGRCAGALHAYLRGTVAATVGSILQVKAGLSLRVTNVDTERRRVQVAVV